jgi:hypothetical protein
MRSGYLHPEVKYDYVISGAVEVWVLTPKGTDKKVYRKLETFEIPEYTPHVLHFLEDSIIVEWWKNQPHESQCWYYHPYRNIVDVQNSLVSTSTGRHSSLVPQNDFDHQWLSENNDSGIGWGSLIWMTSGVAMGLILGITLARQK